MGFLTATVTYGGERLKRAQADSEREERTQEGLAILCSFADLAHSLVLPQHHFAHVFSQGLKQILARARHDGLDVIMHESVVDL
jgi:hypothetical protein